MIRVNRFTISWLALATLLALLALASGCTRPASRAPDTARRASESATESFSVYELPASWRDQAGATRSLSELRGQPVLVAMIYTHCTATCPLAVAELHRIAALDTSARVVLVSLDPQRDDPDRLARYAREHGLDAARWTLLTGSDGDVRELAATLGVRYRRVTPDDLAHSNLITLLDSEGRIVDQSSGRLDVATIAALHATAR